MTTIEQEDRVRNLEAFANAFGITADNNLPATMAAAAARVGDQVVVGAQPVAVHRDEVRVLQKLTALGAAVGSSWYYRFPVKKKGGGTDYIEGPSIKLANDLGRIYGNCVIQVRVIDFGDHWMIYARFNDVETGYALERPFRQYKGASKIGGTGDDADARRLDIAMQIGVSKAIRNVTINALQTFADEAMDAAKNSLIEKIGRDLLKYRDRVVKGIANQNIELNRVERVINRASKDWTAPDVAKVIAMMKAIADGMATVDDTFPAPQEEKIDPKTGEVLDKFAANGKDKDVASETNATNATQSTAPSEASPSDSVEGGKQQQDIVSSEGPDAAGDAEADDDGLASASTTADVSSTADVPKTDVQYKLHAKTWIAEQTNAEECNARWAREKKLRKDCNITQETFDELEALKKTRVNDLKKTKS